MPLLSNLIPKFQRRFSDLKWGYSQVGIMIGLSNFLLLIYNFTGVKTILSFEYFVILSIVIIIIPLLLIGTLFRKKQMGVEYTLGFEQAPAQATVFRMILEQLPQTDETMNYIKYLRKIEEKKT